MERPCGAVTVREDEDEDERIEVRLGCYPKYLAFSPHGNQFLGARWVNSHTCVEIPLPCSHFNCHSKPLHHFTATGSYNMHTYNLLFATLTDKLIFGRLQLLLLCRMERIEHGCEACVVGLDVILAILVDSRGLSQSDCTNFGMGKDNRGNVGVVKLLGQMRPPRRVLQAENAI